MKLYVWHSARVNYANWLGTLGVVAESKEAAIAAILKKYPGDKYSAKTIEEEPNVYEVGEVFFWEDEWQ